ncbi:MAG: secondary thiamine-phosphate synthase enzyme YjbQ [Candidatus Asgardarchaeia archaeon]
MKTVTRTIPLSTKKRLEIIDITRRVAEVVRESGISSGFAIVSLPHTTAAVTINESDPDLFDDILGIFSKIVPLQGKYKHNEKYSGLPGEQNAHAHILTSLIKPNLVVSIENSELDLGTWQSILFIELDGPRNRKVKVKIIGE